MAVTEHCEGKGFFLNHSIDKKPVDERFELHIHEDYELFCLVRGKVGYIVEGHYYNLKPGALLLMRSSEMHKLVVNESDEYERYVLNFRPEIFEKSVILAPYTDRALGERNLYLPSELGSLSAISFFEKIFSELCVLDTETAVISNISALLCSVALAFYASPSTLKTSDDIGQRIISYINENLTSDISIGKISDAVHLSASQLNRIFKRLSGASVYDYILSKRLILFQQKTAEGKSALIASQECGFKDYSAFYRLFKKRFGYAPTYKR